MAHGAWRGACVCLGGEVRGGDADAVERAVGGVRAVEVLVEERRLHGPDEHVVERGALR